MKINSNLKHIESIDHSQIHKHTHTPQRHKTMHTKYKRPIRRLYGHNCVSTKKGTKNNDAFFFTTSKDSRIRPGLIYLTHEQTIATTDKLQQANTFPLSKL